MTGLVDESRAQRWTRRAFTIPAYTLACVALVIVLPLLLLVTLARDGLRDRRLPATRLLGFAVVFLVCETLGLAAALVVGALTAGQPERGRRWHYALQGLWARALFAAACRFFGFRVEVEGDDAVGRGPLLVLVRHVSLADTLLPAVFVAHRHGLRLRYVLKRELLWDPCLDVVGQRLPNVFVRRGSDDSAREIARLRPLGEGLGVGEGILIYPEGTRFTPAKRARVQASLAAADPMRAARVAGWRHVLPPRVGGPLALLDAHPGADVLFLAHAGLEAAGTLGDIWRGALVGRRVRLAFWTVAAADVPQEPTARVAWLDGEWARMEAWVAAHAGPGAAGA